MANSNTARASDIAQDAIPTISASAYLVPCIQLPDDGPILLAVPGGAPIYHLTEAATYLLAGTSELLTLCEESELFFKGGQRAADVMSALQVLVGVAKGMTYHVHENLPANGGVQ